MELRKLRIIQFVLFWMLYSSFNAVTLSSTSMTTEALRSTPLIITGSLTINVRSPSYVPTLYFA
nr:MAG TPA_asm: hypothetical protein [Caudoviricetes sp.]